MRRYLLDTGIASDFIHRRRGVDSRVGDAVLRGDIVGICVPVLCELWAGIELSASRDQNIDRMKHALARLRIWPLEVKAGETYGRLYAELRRMGRPMQVIDIQIAAIALWLGNCTVVSKDSDLSAVPGLSVENWATP
jgi:tRNA(fMet)-specific endonuclease VapC